MPVLTITCRLAAPVAVADEIHIDGVLMATLPGGRTHIDRRTPLADLPHVAIPMAHLDHQGHHVGLCTAAAVDPAGARVNREHLTKRRDAVDTDYLAGPYTPKSGPGKDYLLPITVVETATLTWRAIGSRRAMILAVRHIRSVGSYRRHGYGAVVAGSWVVTTDRDVDPATVLAVDGLAARHLPRSWCLAASRTDRGAVAPPYWHPGRIVDRAPAGTRVMLDDRVVEAARAYR